MTVALIDVALLLVLTGAVSVVLWRSRTAPASGLLAAAVTGQPGQTGHDQATALTHEDTAAILSFLGLIEGHVRAIKWLLAVLLLAIAVMHVFALAVVQAA